jgi:hypothetical protein
MTQHWYDAEVVNLKGLKARARDNYAIGMKVKAHLKDGEPTSVVIQGTGMYGTDAIVPRTLIRFTGMGVK